MPHKGGTSAEADPEAKASSSDTRACPTAASSRQAEKRKPDSKDSSRPTAPVSRQPSTPARASSSARSTKKAIKRKCPKDPSTPDRAEPSALSPVRIITSTRPDSPSRSPSSRPVSVIIARAHRSRAERTAATRQWVGMVETVEPVRGRAERRQSQHQSRHRRRVITSGKFAGSRAGRARHLENRPHRRPVEALTASRQGVDIGRTHETLRGRYSAFPVHGGDIHRYQHQQQQQPTRKALSSRFPIALSSRFPSQ